MLRKKTVEELNELFTQRLNHIDLRIKDLHNLILALGSKNLKIDNEELQTLSQIQKIEGKFDQTAIRIGSIESRLTNIEIHLGKLEDLINHLQHH